MSQRLYSGVRPIYRSKQNAITANPVGCIHGRNALKVERGVLSQLKTIGPGHTLAGISSTVLVVNGSPSLHY